MIKLSKDSHVELVEAFIKLGADVHVQDDFALIYASEYGQLDVVKCLIKNGAGLAASPSMALEPAAAPRPDKVGDIHARNDNAFYWASHNGHLNVVKYLISQGSYIHIDNDSALVCASQYGHLEVVKCLISHGAEGLRHSWRCSGYSCR
jgi:ankyrin repeat protein